jgi:phosphatidylserine/phosphatidylglycerophosphate/cardiolipin synthase-like enzyme
MATEIYCTYRYRAEFPTFLKPSFRDLDDFLRQLFSTARKSITIVSPYLGSSGLLSMAGALAVGRQRGSSIRIVTELSHGLSDRNAGAIKALARSIGASAGGGLRVLASSEGLALLHSKLIVVDSRIGYLGSANLSKQGLENNFEVGVSLGPEQARALDELIDHFEACGILTDHTGSLL